MRIAQRTLLSIIVSAVAVGAGAQAFPTQPIRFILPQPPGSGTDVAIRLVADKMTSGLKQPIVIENRAGASGAIAAEAVVKAPPDGYTLFACTSTTQVMLPLVSTRLTFDPHKALVAIGAVSRAENTLVVPGSSPFRTVADLIAYGKANPGKLTYGTAGIGTTHHLAAELLQSLAGFTAVHVPYKGTPLAEADLVSGRLDFILNNTAPALPNIQAGRTRALMVTGANRSPELPSTPTSKEVGFADFEVYGFTGICAPAKTPQAVIDRLYEEMAKAVSAPEVREKLLQLGFDGKPMKPDELTQYVNAETNRWRQVIRARNLEFK